MKKRITMLLVFFFLLLFSFAASASFSAGDMNGDGKITAADARTVLRIAAELEKAEPEQRTAADVDGDGAVTAADARIVLRVAAKLDVFPERPVETETQEDRPPSAPPEKETETAEPDTDAFPYFSQEAILAKYTEVMDTLKAHVLTYEKKEFQILDDDYDLGPFGNLIFPILEKVVTSEAQAEIQHRDDAGQIPVIGNTKGCLLTDASAIQSASLSEKDGKTTIVIVLNEEENPEPAEWGASAAPSATGAMFDPVSPAAVEDIAAMYDPTVKIDRLSLRYWGCTATLVFDTQTLQVESLQQTMNVFALLDLRTAFLSLSGYVKFANHMTIDTIQYES